PGSVGSDCEQMRSRGLRPLRPVPIQQVVGYVRFDLAGVGSFCAVDVAGIALAFWVDAGNERNPISGRCPNRTARTAAYVRDLPRISSTRISHPDLSVGDVRYALSIR